MIVLGLILLVLGLVLGIGIFTYIGAALIVIGLILLALGTAGPVRGRWY